MTFKDHFSRQAGRYTRFRPRYPQELFRFLASLVARPDVAWDCGSGNGQAAVDLADLFSRVVATDPSAKQIAQAQQHERVTYLVAAAEHCPLESQSVDLITVAQALHWFDLDRFYDEARRVARRPGVLAAWSYGLFQISPEVDGCVEHLYHDVVGPYWPPERKWIEEHYATIPFPFDEIVAPRFAMQNRWNLDDVIGYLGTWSSVERFIQQRGADPVEQMAAELRRAWGDAQQIRAVEWPLYQRVGRIS